tara:strand:- start:180 stop:401 length:222 start_codon:yes stop_codon:yes gene_type:complete
MTIKLLSTEYTNELLLHLLPFETGYLLRVPKEGEELSEEEKLKPCEHSVQFAIMLRSIDFTMNPHNAALAHEN